MANNNYYIDIQNHVFQPGYDNNTGFFADTQGVELNGVRFKDFSVAQGVLKGVSTSIANGASRRLIQAILGGNETQQKKLDQINKIIGMIFVNWNGAVIKNANFSTGADVTISDTPEFLAIFNNITKVLYNDVILESQIPNRIPLSIVLVKTFNKSTEITSLGYVFDTSDDGNKTVVDMIVNNSSSSPITVTIKVDKSTSNVGFTDNRNIPRKTQTNEDLVVTIPGNGYGEFNLIFIKGTGNTGTIYVRGV